MAPDPDHRLLGHVLGHPGVAGHGVGQTEHPALVAPDEGDGGRLVPHGHAGQEGLVGQLALGHAQFSHPQVYGRTPHGGFTRRTANPEPLWPVFLVWPQPLRHPRPGRASGCLVCTSSGPSWSPAPAGPAGPSTWPPLPPSPLAGCSSIWSAYVHFHLWSETDGYRSIPTIGPLFLLQSIAGLVIGVGVDRGPPAVGGRHRDRASRSSTVAGFLLSVAVGLFGFKDSWLAPFAKEAFTIEILAAVAFVAAGVLCLVEIGSPRSRRLYPGRHSDVGTIPDRALRPSSPGGAQARLGL